MSEHGANIAAQVLSTDAEIGYIVMDLDHDVDGDLKAAIDGLRDQHPDEDPLSRFPPAGIA
ncbi:MAG TPA: hypothetical protein VHC69_04030 [Polyangiaceae bacterium]|nr:hypothetical protein [Polyangiaceae bacterium]